MLPLLLAAVTLVPLHGMPLAGLTHLRLLVAAKPPFVYDVDHHRVTPMRVRVPSTGLYALWTVTDSRDGPVAILDRGCRSCRPRIVAYRVAPDGTGRSIPLPRDPASPRPPAGTFPLPGGSSLARRGQQLTLIAPDGAQTPLGWPSILTWFDGVQPEPGATRALVTFADPAWNDGPAQALDAWMLDPSTGAFSELPAFPALVDLKFSSLRWIADGRLVFLARGQGHGLLAIWRPGEATLAVRRVRLPAPSGSAAFAVY
jgi:hypothetical protein